MNKKIQQISKVAGNAKIPSYIPYDHISKEMEERVSIFRQEVLKAGEGKPLPILEEFIQYWTAPFQEAPNVMRFEVPETWSTKGRIATWLKNSRGWQQDQQQQQIQRRRL